MTAGSGRPWGPLKGDDPALHDLARALRGLARRASMTAKQLGVACGRSDTTVSKWLDGANLPEWRFVEKIVTACVGPGERERFVREVQSIWRRAASSTGRRSPRVQATASVIDAHSLILSAKNETIDAQSQVIDLLGKLSAAQERLRSSLEAEQRATNLVMVLSIGLIQLSTLVARLKRERESGDRLASARRHHDRAEQQLAHAEDGRLRASELAEAAQNEVDRLQRTVGREPDGPAKVTPPVPAVDGMLAETDTALDRTQQLLDDQERELARLESTAANSEGHMPLDADLEMLTTTFDSVTFGVCVIDADSATVWANRAFRQLVGRGADEPLTLRALLSHGSGRRLGEALADLVGGRVPDGPPPVLFEDEVGPLLGASLDMTRLPGPTDRFLVMVRDESEAQLLAARLHHSSLHDSLTGLPNRDYLLDALRTVLEHGGPATILHLGLNALSLVNDGMGLRAGDAVLLHVATRLHAIAGDATVARLGGDQFAVLLRQPLTMRDVTATVDHISEEVSEPLYLDDGRGLRLSASIGILHPVPHGEDSPERVLLLSEQALRRAKHEGRG